MDGGWGVWGGLADRQRAQAVTHAELSDSHQRARPIATIWHHGPGHPGQPGRPFISEEMYGETEWCFFSSRLSFIQQIPHKCKPTWLQLQPPLSAVQIERLCTLYSLSLNKQL